MGQINILSITWDNLPDRRGRFAETSAVFYPGFSRRYGQIIQIFATIAILLVKFILYTPLIGPIYTLVDCSLNNARNWGYQFSKKKRFFGGQITDRVEGNFLQDFDYSPLADGGTF